VRARQKVEVVSLLHQHGADMRARDMLGRTPLHAAAAAGSTQAASALVQLGANVEASDSHLPGVGGGGGGEVGGSASGSQSGGVAEQRRGTPLHWAAHMGHNQMCKVLVGDLKARVDAVGPYRRTPLHTAVLAGPSHRHY